MLKMHTHDITGIFMIVISTMNSLTTLVLSAPNHSTSNKRHESSIPYNYTAGCLARDEKWVCSQVVVNVQ
jgi:hypothetical protein